MPPKYLSDHVQSAIADAQQAPAAKLVRRVTGLQHAESSGLAHRRRGAALMAVVALLGLFFRRWDYDNPGMMIGEAISGVGLLCLALGFSRVRQSAPTSWSRTNGSGPKTKPPKSNRMYQRQIPVLVVLLLLLPWLADLIGRWLSAGNAMEILMLGSLAWGALAAALISTQARTVSLSVVCSGFLTLFTTFISDSQQATWFAYAWGVLCLWWLVTDHWEQVQCQAATEIRGSGQYRLLALTAGCAAFVVVGAIVSNRIPVLHKLKMELLPTSGGTSMKDSVGRGVGNGDALVAARNHPTSFGTVETDMFLESSKPSLFDVVGDEMGKPKRNRRVERAQSIRGDDIQVAAGQFSEANQSSSGSDFSTQRSAPRQREKPSNIVRDSLMFWVGKPGAHLAVERFTEFDGVDWSNRPETLDRKTWKQPKVQIVSDQTWFYSSEAVFPRQSNPYVGALTEAVKFTRFRSPTIPSRSGLQMWSVDRLDRPDFFAIDANDVLFMPDRLHVPDYTVVRMIGSRIDQQRAQQMLTDKPRRAQSSELDSNCRELMAKILHENVPADSQGWSQVAAVIDCLRTKYQYDRLWRPEMPEDQQTPLEQFLWARRGPSYLFATAAAQMLNHLGHETRLVTGFYVNRQNWLAAQRETAILPSDAHVWLEIDVGQGYWIPLEPTPGYDAEPMAISWLAATKQAGLTIAVSVLTMACGAGAIYLARRLVLEWLSRLGWLAAKWVSHRRRVAWLAWLLDARCRLSGLPRKAGDVLRVHLRSVLGDRLPSELDEQLHRCLLAADRVCYGGYLQLSPEDQAAIGSVWQNLTCSQIRRSAEASKRSGKFANRKSN